MSKSKEEYETILENTPDEYLAVVFKFADWIDISYKNLAVQYKENPKAIRELYLCACDKVPIDMLTITQKQEPIEEIFRLARKKYLETLILREYTQPMEEMKPTTSFVEKEIKSMSETINDIEENLPNFDELFLETSDSNPVSDVEMLQKESNINKNIDERTKLEEKESSARKIFKSISKLKKCISNYFVRNRISPVSYVQEMTKNGFSTEQIAFVLDCMNEGMEKRELDNIIISPSLPVEMMEKLKKMQLEKRKEHEKNGK